MVYRPKSSVYVKALGFGNDRIRIRSLSVRSRGDWNVAERTGTWEWRCQRDSNETGSRDRCQKNNREPAVRYTKRLTRRNQLRHYLFLLSLHATATVGRRRWRKRKKKEKKKEQASLLRSTPVKNAISVFTRRLRVPSSACPRVSARGRLFYIREIIYIRESIYIVHYRWLGGLIGLLIAQPIASIDRTSSFRHAGLMTRHYYAPRTHARCCAVHAETKNFILLYVHRKFQTARVLI